MDNFIRQSNKKLISVTKIITLFYLESNSKFVFEGESHNFWEFNYIDKGSLIFKSGNREFLLNSGEMVFFKPNEFHHLEANKLSPPNTTIVSFVCNSPAMKFFENKILKLNDDERKLLSILLKEGRSVYQTLTAKPPVMGMRVLENAPNGAKQMTFNLLEQFLITLTRRNDSTVSRDTRAVLPMQDENYPDKLKEIIFYMDKNVDKKLMVKDLAKEFLMSESTIKKMFSNTAHSGVTDFFNTRKILKAKQLIRENNLNITQISEKLGFSSIHYFSRLFKKKTKMSPSEYQLSIND